MNILLADDEPLARTRLRQLLGDSGDTRWHIVGEAGNGRETLQLASELAPDLILLDIRMPDMDGIECARHLNQLPRPPAIIFTTAYDQYALQAFDLNAIDYLLKPIRLERLQQALNKAIPLTQQRLSDIASQLHSARQHFSVHERGKVTLIPVHDVLYLKAEQKYLTLRTREQDYLLEESLTQLEQEFTHQFVRIHRNCLVNRDAIAGFERGNKNESGEEGSGWQVVLKESPERLCVSRRQQHVVRELGK